MTRWERFQQCPGCGLDLLTDEGMRGCRWGDCPYIPEELDVWCPQCRYNFYTGEGNPPCADPDTCEHGAEARSHLPAFRAWAEAQARLHPRAGA